MPAIVHGTTLQRAERIQRQGPDPNFREPGAYDTAREFSVYLAEGPFLLGKPEEYACRKAALFPQEGGAAIIEVVVPQEILDLAAVDGWTTGLFGVIQFEEGAGLSELKAAWPTLACTIHKVECP